MGDQFAVEKPDLRDSRESQHPQTLRPLLGPPLTALRKLSTSGFVYDITFS